MNDKFTWKTIEHHVSTQHLVNVDFSGPGYDWVCTIHFADPERRHPVDFAFIVWQLWDKDAVGFDGADQDRRMNECLSAFCGYPVQVTDIESGNGHGSGKINLIRNVGP